MLDLLDTVMTELPTLLRSTDGWRGLKIDYHPPFVDRAWRQHGENRVSIHRIYPCAPGAALLHPHPWPSAMRVLAGRYEMTLGYGAGIVAPPIAARLVLAPGTTYEMIDRDTWHDVRPLDEPVLTVMVSGPPWDRTMPVLPDEPQRPLPDDELRALIAAASECLPT